MSKNEKAKAKAKSKNTKVKIEEKSENQIGLFINHKPFDYGLFIIVIILLTLGLIMILSSSAPYALRTEGDSYYYFSKQLKFAVAGLVLMLVLSKVDYRILNSRIAWLAYFAGLRTDVLGTGSRYWC